MNTIFRIASYSQACTITQLTRRSITHAINAMTDSDEFMDKVISTYATREEADAAAKSMSSSIRITSGHPCGKHIDVSWHYVEQVTLDEDGDEIDMEESWSFDRPSADEITDEIISDIFGSEEEEEDNKND